MERLQQYYQRYEDDSLLYGYIVKQNEMKKIQEEIGAMRLVLLDRALTKGTVTNKGHRLLKIGEYVFKREIRRTISFTKEATSILIKLAPLEEFADIIVSPSKSKVEKLIKEKKIPQPMIKEIFEVAKETFVAKVLEDKDKKKEEENAS